MRYVSGSLELDFHTKDKTGIRFPTLNFMDTQSLLTWLETRKMILEMGERFQTRIQLYISYFMSLCALLLTFVFAVLSGAVSKDALSTEQWISFSVYSGVLFVTLLCIMLPTSYLNKEIFVQMRFLTKRREVY